MGATDHQGASNIDIHLPKLKPQGERGRGQHGYLIDCNVCVLFAYNTNKYGVSCEKHLEYLANIIYVWFILSGNLIIGSSTTEYTTLDNSLSLL